MSNLWYYTENNKKVGPVSVEALRQFLASGKLKPTDKVLQENTTSWVPILAATAVPPKLGSAVVPSSSVPPLPLPPDQQGDVTPQNKEMGVIHLSCPSCGMRLKAASSLAGKKSKCKKCGHLMTIQTVSTAGSRELANELPESEEESLPPPNRFQRVKRVMEISLGLGIVGGFAGDMFRPLAPTNFYVFCFSAALAVLLLVFSLGRRGVALTTLFFFCLGAGFGGWWALGEFKGGKEKGVLAGNFPFMEKLQTPLIEKKNEKRGITSQDLLNSAEKEKIKSTIRETQETKGEPGKETDRPKASANPEPSTNEDSPEAEKDLTPTGKTADPRNTGEQPKGDKGMDTVVGEGVGENAEEALKDAFRNAVRQVVGAVVDAETLIKNDEIIKDQVLTYSDGFIKTYDEISKTQEQGLWKVKIKATVERRSVVAKLKAAKITVTNVDGRGIFAEVVTQLDAEKNARDLLIKAMEGFPLNLMVAEVVGKPEVIERTSSKATLRITICFQINKKAFDTYAEKLRKVLEAIKKEKHEVSFVLQKFQVSPFAGWVGNAEALKPVYKGEWDLIRKSSGNDKSLFLALSTQATKNLDRIEWTCYNLDKTCQGTLENCIKRLTAKLSFIGSDGFVIAVDRFLVMGIKPTADKPNVLPICHGNFSRGRGNVSDEIFWLSPFFLKRDSHGLNAYPEIKIHRTITLSLPEINTIQNVKCELSETVPSKPGKRGRR